MLVTISRAIAVLLLFTVPIAAGQEGLDYSRILRAGCTVERLDPKAWRAYVWADYQDAASKHDFTLWLSERNNRRKAMNDCDDWLTAAEKKRAEVVKTKTPGQPAKPS